MLGVIFTLAVMSIAVGTASMTITKSSVFKSLRLWVVDRSDFFGELINCPYCTSHWVAGLAVLLVQPTVVVSPLSYWPNLVVNFAVATLVVVALAMPVVAMIFYSTRGLPPPSSR